MTTLNNSSPTEQHNETDHSALILLAIRYWKVVVPIIVVLCPFEWYVFDYLYDLKHSNEIYQTQMTIANLKKEVIDLKEKQEEKDKIINSLERKLERQEVKIDDFNREILEKRDRIHELENQLNYYKIRVKP